MPPNSNQQVQEFDVTVVGAGIAGLAHAWIAAKRGLRVKLVERTCRAEGATVRNFGMIWPIGQPSGSPYEIALRSRECWLELSKLAQFPIEECGSLHVAHNPDELAVLEEFCALKSHTAQMLTAAEVTSAAPIVNHHGLIGGMQSTTEMRVNPRIVAAQIAEYLGSLANVVVSFETTIVALAGNRIESSDGTSWRSDRIVICCGSDLQTLYPQQFANSELRLCKLQMLKAACSQPFAALVPHIASGLTLRHYRSFDVCPSIETLRRRVHAENPALDRFGIHVMASTFPDGSIILGDSHEYDSDITPFDKAEIDELMLKELKKIITLDAWNITEHWSGVYAKHPRQIVYERELAAGHFAFTGLGGAGMTLSLGLASAFWDRQLGAIS